MPLKIKARFHDLIFQLRLFGKHPLVCGDNGKKMLFLCHIANHETEMRMRGFFMHGKIQGNT
jgi:hypothetical protein